MIQAVELESELAELSDIRFGLSMERVEFDGWALIDEVFEIWNLIDFTLPDKICNLGLNSVASADSWESLGFDGEKVMEASSDFAWEVEFVGIFIAFVKILEAKIGWTMEGFRIKFCCLITGGSFLFEFYHILNAAAR